MNRRLKVATLAATFAAFVAMAGAYGYSAIAAIIPRSGGEYRYLSDLVHPFWGTLAGWTSLLVGLLYGAMLPMFPRRPILLGGIVAPIFWTGIIHSVLGLVNPLLDQLISWPWFAASQFAFGIVAGLVVVKQERVRTRQLVPFLARAGIDAPGMMKERSGKDAPQ